MGICSSSVCRMARMRMLFSGSPGTMAGPESPPFRTPSRLSRKRPPLALPAEALWHL